MATLLEYLQMNYGVALDVDPEGHEPWCYDAPTPADYRKAYRERKKAERQAMIANGEIDAPLIEVRESKRARRPILSEEDRKERQRAAVRRYYLKNHPRKNHPRKERVHERYAEPVTDRQGTNRLSTYGMLSKRDLSDAESVDIFILSRISHQIDGDHRGKPGWIGLTGGCYWRSRRAN